MPWGLAQGRGAPWTARLPAFPQAASFRVASMQCEVLPVHALDLPPRGGLDRGDLLWPARRSDAEARVASRPARYVDPSGAAVADPANLRVRQDVVEALQEFEANEGEGGRDFLAWMRLRAPDDELTTLVARVAATEAPALTEEAIKKQLTVAVTEQSKIQAKRLTEEIRRAESKRDDASVAVLQERLQQLRSRRPEL